MEQLFTPDLLQASDALLAETGRSRDEFLFEAHSRFAQSFIAAGAALIGFSSLLLGAFSRFGLWRQILVAILLLLVVQAAATMTSSSARVASGNWGLVYVSPALGIAIGLAELWITQRPRRVKRAGAAA